MVDQALASAGIRAEPLSIHVEDDGRTLLRRCDVRKHVDDPLALLWHTLAWGAGPRRRLCRRRIEGVAVDVDGARRVLSEAAAAARHEPGAAYRLLYPQGRSALPALGPAFGTKYLYFAGAGDREHPSLILDSRVASALRGHGWSGLSDWGWAADTYGDYCNLLEDWRQHSGAASAAQWELALFRAG